MDSPRDSVAYASTSTDEVLRLATVTEHRKWGAKGEWGGRVAWAFSFDGLLDAAATFPCPPASAPLSPPEWHIAVFR